MNIVDSIWYMNCGFKWVRHCILDWVYILCSHWTWFGVNSKLCWNIKRLFSNQLAVYFKPTPKWCSQLGVHIMTEKLFWAIIHSFPGRINDFIEWGTYIDYPIQCIYCVHNWVDILCTQLGTWIYYHLPYQLLPSTKPMPNIARLGARFVYPIRYDMHIT